MPIPQGRWLSWPWANGSRGLFWRLKELASVRAGGRSCKIHCGGYREANEEWQLVRIVVQDVDSHRQTLHYFNEIARCVLCRQQSQRRSSTHGETEDPPLEEVFAAVHIQLQVYMLADSQLAKLGLLEIRVYPDITQRADGHNALASLEIVARVHVTAGDNAVNLRVDRAIAQIEFCLIEIALGLHHVRFS